MTSRPAAGFVQKDKAGVMAESQENFQQGFHAGGKVFRFFVHRKMVSVTAGYKGVAVEIPVKSFHHGDDVPDVQIIAEPGIGKDDADLFAVGTAEVPDVSAEDFDIALVKADQTENGFECRTLSGTVGSHQTGNTSPVSLPGNSPGGNPRNFFSDFLFSAFLFLHNFTAVCDRTRAEPMSVSCVYSCRCRRPRGP